MKKTSNAVWVLLLLQTAQAAEVDPGYTSATYTFPTANADAIAQLNLNGKYVKQGNPVYQAATFLAAPTIASCGTAAGGGTIVAGVKSCMDCIRGKATAAQAQLITSVWCSAAWNYSYKSLPFGSAYPHKLTLVATTYTFDPYGGSATVDQNVDGTNNTGDLGSCCATKATLDTLYGVALAAAEQSIHNVFTCPARWTNDSAAAGAGTVIVRAAATEDWWCSDGTFNVAGGASLGMPASGGTAWETGLAGKTMQSASNFDRRFDLFFAACRQKDSICSQGWVSGVSATASTRTIIASKGFTTSEKCTWNMSSTTKAPTFKIYNTAGATVFLPADYDIMYSEWVDGWNGLVSGTDYRRQLEPGAAVANSGGVIFPHLTAAKYGTVAKYNYPGKETNASETTNGQSLGSVFTIVKNGKACVPVDTIVSTPLACIDTDSKVRWFGATEATTGVKLAAETLAAYNTAKGTFNTAATAYNAYLAAMVTPPDVKPTQVMRPTSPTVPATYTGLQHWTGAKQATFQTTAPAAGFPTWGTEFIAGNRPNEPGWGAWTISRIVPPVVILDALPISHSFGNVGVHWGSTVQQSNSWVKQYFTAGAAWAQLTAASLQGAHTAAGNIMCQSTTASNKCTAVTTTAPAANTTKYVYLSVSVWASGTTTATDFAGDFKIDFLASDWASDDLLFAPAAASAPTALTAEPAFAKTLTASAVAVVAIASALY